MFRLSKEFRFEAAHYLPFHDGKCRDLHGHSWKCCLHVTGQNLFESGPKQGMLIDFTDMNKWCKYIHDKLDHKCLNDIIENPTSERVAMWIWDEISEHLPLEGVEIEETCTSRCLYWR